MSQLGGFRLFNNRILNKSANLNTYLPAGAQIRGGSSSGVPQPRLDPLEQTRPWREMDAL
jgi:hypothetical protein